MPIRPMIAYAIYSDPNNVSRPASVALKITNKRYDYDAETRVQFVC